MARRSTPDIRGGTASGWEGPTVVTTSTDGKHRLYKTWYSPDGTTWEPQDAANTDYSITLNASAASESQINLSWTAVGGATYKLYRTGGPSGTGPLPNSPAALSYNDTGLAASAGYSYRIDAIVDGTVAVSNYASAATPAAPPPPPPPTSSSSWIGPGVISSGGYMSCTAVTLRAATANISGYISNFDLYMGKYNGDGKNKNGHCDPTINGTRLGYQDITTGLGWQLVNGRDTPVNGSCQVGAHTGGNCNYYTEWKTYSGQGTNWKTTIACGTINYWWYTRSADEAWMYTQPWWDEELLGGREIHMDQWADHDGAIWKVKIVDKKTRNVLVEWESPDNPERKQPS